MTVFAVAKNKMATRGHRSYHPGKKTRLLLARATDFMDMKEETAEACNEEMKIMGYFIKLVSLPRGCE